MTFSKASTSTGYGGWGQIAQAARSDLGRGIGAVDRAVGRLLVGDLLQTVRAAWHGDKREAYFSVFT
jgi:hypothetical protein